MTPAERYAQLRAQLVPLNREIDRLHAEGKDAQARELERYANALCRREWHGK